MNEVLELSARADGQSLIIRITSRQLGPLEFSIQEKDDEMFVKFLVALGEVAEPWKVRTQARKQQRLKSIARDAAKEALAETRSNPLSDLLEKCFFSAPSNLSVMELRSLYRASMLDAIVQHAVSGGFDAAKHEPTAVKVAASLFRDRLANP